MPVRTPSDMKISTNSPAPISSGAIAGASSAACLVAPLKFTILSIALNGKNNPTRTRRCTKATSTPIVNMAALPRPVGARWRARADPSGFPPAAADQALASAISSGRPARRGVIRFQQSSAAIL